MPEGSKPFWRLICYLGLGFGLSIGLGGCAPPVLQQWPTASEALDLNGPAPDVVIIGMSGHCTPICHAPNDNHEALQSGGTLRRLADAVQAAGLSVQVASYSSNAQESYFSAQGGAVQRGWPALRRDYQAIGRVWAADPPRVVLVGHSHGVPWLHGLVRQFPEQRVAALIDIDGVCELWNLDHRAALLRLSAEVRGQPDIAEACHSLPTMPWRGSARLSAKDLVPWNVEHGLELLSVWGGLVPKPADGLPLNIFWDSAPNIRPDGSGVGLQVGYSQREGHSYLPYPDSDGMRWLTGQLYRLAQQWR